VGSFLARVIVCLFLLPSAFCLLPSASAAPPPSREDIARWVQQLGDKRFANREQASKRLWAAGQQAEAALRTARQSADPEVARRAREILDKFKYGIYPDTPKNVLKLIADYRTGEQAVQQRSVQELFKLGQPGWRVIAKLVAAEENADVRRVLVQQVAQDASTAAKSQIADGRLDEAEELLELSVAGQTTPALCDYAAFHRLRGSLEDKIRRARARVGDKQAAELLVYLYRVKGDLKSARRAAEQSGQAELLEVVLDEQGDWKALNKMLSGTREATVSPAALVTIHRLAGDTAAFKADVRQLASATDEVSLHTLFFNDRPREAIAALVNAKAVDAAVNALCFQMKFGEAFALADKAGDLPDRSRVLVDLSRARALYVMGDRDKALDLFSGIADGLKGENRYFGYANLVQVESQLGLKDQALEHCARYVAQSRSDEPKRDVRVNHQANWLLWYIFPKDKLAAEVWFEFLQKKFPEDKTAAVLRRVRDLFEHGKVGKDFAGLAREAEGLTDRLPSQERAQWLQGLGETCLAAGRDDLAQTYLEKAARDSGGPGPAMILARSGERVTTAAFLKLGDLHADKKRWRQAAECYGEAWESDRKDIVPLYLWGWALTQAGQEKQGKELMARAHLMPLADAAERYRLAEELARRKLADGARQEHDLIISTSEFHSFYVTNIMNRVARDALSQKDYLKAADCYQRLMLNLMYRGGSFREAKDHLVVPYLVHARRAQGLVAAGRISEARPHIEACLDVLPWDLDLPIALVPELDRAGHKKEGDHLFARVFTFYEKLCADHPRSGSWHNSLGWLAARCRRRLDGGLEHAREAVALDPKNAGFLDTLAEVHFQRGEKGKAIALMKECIGREPKREYFRKQLRRFEAGDLAAEVPPER
jgi:tetratricopeptide (TPR) repeat protein